MRRKAYLALILTLLLIAVMVIPSAAADHTTIGLDTFEEILDNIETYHVSNPDPDALIRGAIDGLINSLGDPHTQYIGPEQLASYEQSLEGDYIGVGIQLQEGQEYPEVASIFENSPAWKAGIRPGDLVIKVDGLDTTQETLEKIVQKIQGPEGTQVLLTIRRQGTRDIEIKLVRAKINMPQVSGKMLNDSIGYIAIDTFGSKAADEFELILGGLLQQGADKLILDLRDNPGGLIWAMTEIGSNFIDYDHTVIRLVDRNGTRTDFATTLLQPIGKGMEVVVLINQNTASSAEALAGALQDYGSATLLGIQTYGKGSAQNIIYLDSGGVLLITTAKFYTPKGRSIDGVGVSPDVQVQTPELYLVAAQRYLQPPDKYTVVFETDKDKAIVNGTSLNLRHMFLERGSKIYLPARFTFEALGYQVFWQPVNQSIKISGFDTETLIYPGNGRIIVDGENYFATDPLLVEDGSTYIPLADLSVFHIKVRADNNKIYLEK